ncbi:MAG: MurR/RpiR family transcriptional regulator [Rhodobacter sp.]|jgi:DNA-binding MurR/RpiR family transcriptional regulator|nr:MurR/RpiR family transcriptional regulator [Rhodobacter sp.]MCA3487774.1 MurR/RpiR family transcriptional regulator [Rhodobacter sp.]MCA3494215.1 MurR/RpiR family transcriptional regulator [Rhodobacter sp.]MCA3499603.1 MurR/RpiR family transcriptional regulator [Rhodobacter sp.]MCA3503128.1 MurR/RpiR family transcriptional regulator [Rhodobacter sp.]
MSTRLALRIQEKLDRLTKSERKLAVVILERPGLIETHSATELAVIADISKATAARFFRALGYTDFEEVKLQAREERNRTQPYSYSEAGPGSTVLGRKIGEHLDLELANITRTFEEMSPDTLRQAARLIADAPRLWFMGQGADAWLAHYGRGLFSRLRPNVHAVGITGGAVAEDLAMMGPRDAMVVLAQGPQPRELKAILSYAKTTRASIISLTDHGNLALAKRFSDLALRCHISSYGLIPSCTTLVSVLRLLAISHVGLVGDTAVQRASLIDDINEELDILG